MRQRKEASPNRTPKGLQVHVKEPGQGHAVSNRSHRKTTIWAVSAVVFVLFAAPRLRLVSVGAPIYALDLLSLGSLIATRGMPIRLGVGRALIPLVVIFFTGLNLSQLSRIAFGPGNEEATYMLVRYTACAALFVSALRVMSTDDGPRDILRALTAGVFFTSTVTVAYSISATRGLTKPLFSLRFLAPDTVGDKINTAIAAAERGRSLVGNETLTGAVLGLAWPLLMLTAYSEAGRWRKFAAISALACSAAMVATYSRGSIVMLLASALVLLFLGTKVTRRSLAWIAAILLLAFTGLNSVANASMFDRLERRFASIGLGESDSELSDWGVSEQTRLSSYLSLATYLKDDPSRVALGWGNTRKRFKGPAATFPKHAVITAGTYHFGLFAGLAMSAMAPFILWVAMKRRIRRPSPAAVFLGASAASMLIWQLIGHAPISFPRATSIFLIPVALFATLRTGGEASAAHRVFGDASR